MQTYTYKHSHTPARARARATSRCLATRSPATRIRKRPGRDLHQSIHPVLVPTISLRTYLRYSRAAKQSSFAGPVTAVRRWTSFSLRVMSERRWPSLSHSLSHSFFLYISESLSESLSLSLYSSSSTSTYPLSLAVLISSFSSTTTATRLEGGPQAVTVVSAPRRRAAFGRRTRQSSFSGADSDPYKL